MDADEIPEEFLHAIPAVGARCVIFSSYFFDYLTHGSLQLPSDDPTNCGIICTSASWNCQEARQI